MSDPGERRPDVAVADSSQPTPLICSACGKEYVLDTRGRCYACKRQLRREQRRRDPSIPRAASVSRRDMAREPALDVTEYAVELEEPRPRTRAECIGGPRPCPWVGCSHHLYLDVNPESGSIKFTHPDREPWELAESCALDVADSGHHTLERVGEILNVTRERTRQIEVRALLQLKGADL